MQQQKTKHPLRCFCTRKPILAFYGVDNKDQLYVHIKIYKAHRIFGEIVMTEGVIYIRCRECLRWYNLIIKPQSKPELRETEPPDGSVEPLVTGHG